MSFRPILTIRENFLGALFLQPRITERETSEHQEKTWASPASAGAPPREPGDIWAEVSLVEVSITDPEHSSAPPCPVYRASLWHTQTRRTSAGSANNARGEKAHPAQ